MSVRMYLGFFFAYAVLTSLAVGQDAQRLELVDKISKSGDWLAELGKYKLVMTQRRWSGSEEGGAFRHDVGKYEFGWNGSDLYAYVVTAVAREFIVVSEQAKQIDRTVGFTRNRKNSLLTQRLKPSESSTTGSYDFDKTKARMYRQLQLLPVSKDMMNVGDPKGAIGELLSTIVNDDWKLRCEFDEELGLKRTLCTLVKSTTKGFGILRIRYISSDSGIGLVDKISYGISKRGKTVYESEEDIEAYLYSIQTEYEQVEDLNARVPVRITGEVNDITPGNGGLRVVQSIRLVTTLDWSSFEELSDEDLKERTQRLAEDVETALQ